MSDVSGFISVNLSLTDTTTLPTKTVLKTLALSEDTEITSGVVAIISGTVGTAGISVELLPTTYRDASGSTVSYSEGSPPTRIAFAAGNTNRVVLVDQDLAQLGLVSSSNRVAVTQWGSSSPNSGMTVQTLEGTNTYTIIVLREE